MITNKLNYEKMVKYWKLEELRFLAGWKFTTRLNPKIVKNIEPQSSDYYSKYGRIPNLSFGEESQFQQIINKILSRHERLYLKEIYATQTAPYEHYEGFKRKIIEIPIKTRQKFLSLGLCLVENELYLVPRVASDIFEKRLAILTPPILLPPTPIATKSYLNYDQALELLRHEGNIREWDTEMFCDYFDKHTAPLEHISIEKIIDFSNKRKRHAIELETILIEHGLQYSISSYGKYFKFIWAKQTLYVKWNHELTTPKLPQNKSQLVIYIEKKFKAKQEEEKMKASRYIYRLDVGALKEHIQSNFALPTPRQFMKHWRLNTTQLLECVS